MTRQRLLQRFRSDRTDTTSFGFTNLDASTTRALSSQVTGPESPFIVVSDRCAGIALATG